MDKIGSNSYFNPTQLYQQHQADKSQSIPSKQLDRTASLAANRVDAPQKSTGFANLFADDELSTLQGNFEAIATLAERALKRIDG